MNYLWQFIKENRTILSIIFIAPILAFIILLVYSFITGELKTAPSDWTDAMVSAYGIILASSIDNLRNEKEKKNGN